MFPQINFISEMVSLNACPANETSEREFFIDNLLVQIHCIIVMIRRTGPKKSYTPAFLLLV